ncbi:MAG: type II toxin-antitoxin system RelE family toxin [Parachlamydiaceae bacterium]
MIYEIEISASAEKFLEKVPQRDRLKIIEKIDALESTPLPIGCKKLQGHKELYRLRSGDYRIIYTINKDRLLILVVEIGHRKEIYR